MPTHSQSGPIGGAVLVHGTWGHPEDWQWVRERLEAENVVVSTPDLPSHRSAAAGVDEDAAEVRAAAERVPAPVVLVGWSYGGTVISHAAAAAPQVAHLVYVASSPEFGDVEANMGSERAFLESDPHVEMREDGTYLLDSDWWLNEEAGTTFPEPIRAVLRTHPRRPASLRILDRTDPQPVWERIPTTALLGRTDELMTDLERTVTAERIPDTRVLDTDHFVIFRMPEVVSGVVVEALRAVEPAG